MLQRGTANLRRGSLHPLLEVQHVPGTKMLLALSRQPGRDLNRHPPLFDALTLLPPPGLRTPPFNPYLRTQPGAWQTSPFQKQLWRPLLSKPERTKARATASGRHDRVQGWKPQRQRTSRLYRHGTVKSRSHLGKQSGSFSNG